jgi:chemotaxis protein CheZ
MGMQMPQPIDSAQMKDRPYSRKEVMTIIKSVLGSIEQDHEPSRKLHEELTSLAGYIDSMRSELAQLRSIEISHNHIPTATDELDAVVEETAKATGAIMDACDVIEAIAGGLEDTAVGGDLSKAVTSIYEACTFQDITGQRITKVVKTLKNIEGKVSEIIAAFGHEMAAPITETAKPAATGDGLLNGPQLNGAAVSQAEIDKLLASFD